MIPGSRIHGSMHLAISHIHYIPECCTARMLYYAMGVYLHAATLHPWSTCGLYINTAGSHHQGSHPSGCLPGHDPTHQDPRISGSRICVSGHSVYPQHPASRYAVHRVCRTTPRACTCMLLRAASWCHAVLHPVDLTLRRCHPLDISRVMIPLTEISWI